MMFFPPAFFLFRRGVFISPDGPMIPGNVFFINTVDGEELIMTFLREHRGFLLIVDPDSNVRAIRPSSILTVTDTGRAAKDIQPLKLKKKEEEDLPTEIITVNKPPTTSSTRGRLHL